MQRQDEVFSNTSRCSIIVYEDIRHWDIVLLYVLNRRLWQPNLVSVKSEEDHSRRVKYARKKRNGNRCPQAAALKTSWFVESMPPQVALIICIIFVFWLLRLDHKQAPKVSFVLWIPTIWMLINTSKPLGVWFSMGVGGGLRSVEEGSPLDQALFMTILFIGLIILARRGFNLSAALGNNVLLMLLISYMLVSILWSDIPFVSFKRWSREFIAIVMAFLVATEPEPRQAVQNLLRRIIYILIPFSYVLIHYFPKYGRGYHQWEGTAMWIGVATQKNGLGMICALSAFYLITSFIRRRQGKDVPATRYQNYLEAFLLFLTIWLMGGPNHNISYSVTANLSLLVGLSTFIGLSWLKRKGILIGPTALAVIVAFIVIYGTVTPFVGKLALADITSSLGRDEGLTGRDEIWAELVPLTMERPILGYGFGGFWTSSAIEKARIASAHNGYLDLILNLGFVGHIFFFMFLLSCCWKANRVMNDNFDWGIYLLCYLLMAVVHNIAESSAVVLTGKILVVALMLSVSSMASPSKDHLFWRKV